MPKICMYLQLHQPYRLADYSVFDLGLQQEHGKTYFRDESDHNREIFLKVANKSYRPMLSLLLRLVHEEPEFRFALSCSGVFLDQAMEFAPDVIHLLQELARTDQVEFLAETHYHSLAALYSEQEFRHQVQKHERLVYELFGRRPVIFRNTELIYNNYIAWQVMQLGYEGILTEAVDRHLHGRSRTQLYASNTGDKKIPVMLKHAQLSDDIAFRFSDKNWLQHPLHADTYLEWLSDYWEHEVVNLFMDFETFGEHQWEDTGIFSFFEHMVKGFLHHHRAREWSSFITPSMELRPAKKNVHDLPIYHVEQPISWADVNRDLSAWRDNSLQWDTLRKIYTLEQQILATNDDSLIEDWRRLQTSDHFYYMCIKWSADGDVHAYFSPYDDPHDAYTRYATVVADLQGRLLGR